MARISNTFHIRRTMQRKSQAALEFLITYGWAILSVLIVVSALAYFGIFNTSKYVNDVCQFGDQMTCEDYVLYSNATVAFQLRNNLGVPIDITNLVVKSDYGTIICPLSGIVPNTNIQPGTLFSSGCSITSKPLSTNDKLRVRVVVGFRRSGAGNPVHNQTGSIYVGVSPS